MGHLHEGVVLLRRPESFFPFIFKFCNPSEVRSSEIMSSCKWPVDLLHEFHIRKAVFKASGTSFSCRESAKLTISLRAEILSLKYYL